MFFQEILVLEKTKNVKIIIMRNLSAYILGIKTQIKFVLIKDLNA